MNTLTKAELKSNIDAMLDELNEGGFEAPEVKYNSKTSKGQLEAMMEELQSYISSAAHQMMESRIEEVMDEDDEDEDLDETEVSQEVISLTANEAAVAESIRANQARIDAGLRAYRVLVPGESVWKATARSTKASVEVHKVGYAHWRDTCHTHMTTADFRYRDDAVTYASRPQIWCPSCSKVALEKGLEFTFIGSELDADEMGE